jgi:hypothetical protein
VRILHLQKWLPLLWITRSLFASETHCTFTREYITTLEYLRSHKEFSITEQEAQNLAFKVSRGCTGAAQKFVKVTSVLSQTGVGSKDAIQSGLEFSKRTDAEEEAFVFVFLRSYLKEYLDLDLQSSLKMARSLSVDFDGDAATARDDFEKLVQFCVGSKSLDLPRPQCGTFAGRLSRLGQATGGGIGGSFIRMYTFLISESGPGLTTHEALRLAEEIIQYGKDSADNFIQAYKYGISSKGLKISGRDAIEFAKKITLSPSSESTTHQKENDKLTPGT